MLLTALLRAQDSGIQRGFSDIALGMTLAEAKSALEADPYFAYRGDPDVQFLPATEIPLVDTDGRGFVSRGVFQFQDDLLFVITLELADPLDYFSVYTSLVEQYGEPIELSPDGARWEDGTTRLLLERPLIVKYIDQLTMDQLIETGQVQESLDAVARDRFLEEL